MSEQTTNEDFSIEEVKLPVKRVEADTVEDTLTANAYHNILPARYLQRDEDGSLIEEPAGLFKRVARNVALADSVYQAEDAGYYELTATPADIKPNASQNRRRDLCDEIFSPAVGLSGDDTVRVTEDNIYAFSYDTIVPRLPEELQERVQETYEEFHEDMTSLSFMPNSPTLMNAGDEFQQLSACFVDSPEDDIYNIHETAKEAAKIFQCLIEESTVVEQDKGMISVSEVEESDMILQSSEEGFQYKAVKKTHKYENSPTITLNLENGLEIRGTPNHELLVNGEWARLDKVSKSDEVHYSLGWIEELESSSPVLETVSERANWSRKVSNEEILGLYQNGLSDYEIADRLDVGKSTVQRRRADDMQLPPNNDTGRTSGHITFDEQMFVKMYEDGMTDGQIADELDVSKPTVQRFRNANSMSPNGNPVKEVTQPQHLTTQVAELVGLWAGEGSYHTDGVRFHISREETVQWLEETVQDVFDTSVSKTYSGGCYNVTINSHEIKRFWKKNFDVKSDGSQEVTVPSVISKATPAEIKAYIRGYASADGSIQHNNYPVIYSSSEKCVDQIATLMMGLGMPVRKSCIRDSDENPYYSVRPTTEHGRELFRTEIGFVDDRRVQPVSNPRDTGYDGNGDWNVSVDNVEVDKNADVYDITVEDNHQYITDGIVSHNSGGGVGYAFSRLRPYGDRVGSTGGVASGPISFMRTYDQVCGTIAQGGKRRGAQMGILRVDHPDIIQFIHAKDKDVSLTHSLKLNDPDDFTHNSFGEALEEARELVEYDDDGIGRVPEHLRNAAEGHLSNFNISVGVTGDFMDAVRNNEDYTLINPRTDEPYTANQETKDLYSWFGLGDEVEVGEPLEIPAGEIFDRITEGAWENGEPGMVFLDRANEKHSFDVDEHPEHEILATNPCLSGDMEVAVVGEDEDSTEISKLAERDDSVLVYSLDDDGELTIKEATAFKTKQNAETITINTDGNMTLEVTPDHKIRTNNRGWVEAADLEKDDSLQILKQWVTSAIGGKDSAYKIVKSNNTFMSEHRLVARDVIDQDIEEKQVHHKSLDSLDNDPENLRAVTPEEHQEIHNISGENNPIFKLKQDGEFEEYKDSNPFYNTSGENNPMFEQTGRKER